MPASRPPVPPLGLLLAGALLGGVLLAGCDEHAVGAGGGAEVVLDLRPLFRAGDERCVSVVDALALTVTEADGSERTTTRPLTPDDAEVRIPVEVEPGRVEFEAAVRSNNGTLLYTGSATAEVEGDGFRVEVPLDAVNAVLKACPDLVPLVPGDGDYRGELRVINRGDRATTWEATAETPLCDDAPCFSLSPSAAPIPEGDTVRVVGIALAAAPADTFGVQITSPVGTLAVRFAFEDARPVARPDTAAVLEGGSVVIDVLANDTHPEGAPLALVAVGDALFGAAAQEGDRVRYVAGYTPDWGETSEDRFAYTAEAGGHRAEAEVAVRIVPCIAFEEPGSAEVADVPLVVENGVTAFTRRVHYDADTDEFEFATVDLLPEADEDLGVYLIDAALELDWTGRPVRYLRFDFLDHAAVVNFAINGAARFIGPALTAQMPVPSGVTLRIEDGKFGSQTRLVIEAGPATPITRLLLGGGDASGEADRLILDDICFGLAPPGGG